MPLLLVVAVPVWRPELSRNVVVPFELRVAVPVWRPLVSRKVVCARAAEVTSLSIELTYRGLLTGVRAGQAGPRITPWAR